MTRKGTRRVVAANPVIAATIAAALVARDLAGHLLLPLGVAGHEGSTVLAGLNGLRLLRGAAWRNATPQLRGKEGMQDGSLAVGIPIAGMAPLC